MVHRAEMNLPGTFCLSQQIHLVGWIFCNTGCSTENAIIKGKVIQKQEEKTQPCVSKEMTQCSCLRQMEIHTRIHKESIKMKQQISLTFLLGTFHTGFYQPDPGIFQRGRVWAQGCQWGNSDPQDINNLKENKEGILI